MGDWKKYHLGELITDIAAGPFGSNLKISCFVPSGFPIIDGANLKGFKVTDNITKFVTEEKARSLARSIAKRNDVIVTISGTLGQIAYIPEESEYEEYLCSQRQFRATFDQSQVDVPFLVYYFHSHEGQQKILVYANQVGVPALYQPLKNFRLIEIPLPPLPTQRKIAAVLGALDDKIENNRKICANLEAQAQAIFKSWFVDFEPFGGKMPSGWKMGKLGDVAECNPQRSLKKGDFARCVEMADLVTTGSFPASWNSKNYYGGMKFTNGDTIIARITPCFENGKAAYINFLDKDEVAFGSTEYVVIATRSNVPPELFYCLAKYPEFISFAKSRMVGSSGRQRFSAEDVTMYPFVIATDETYAKIAPLLHSFMDKIRALGLESRALAAMRDALLPKLMSGEIDVEKVKVA